MSQVVRSDGFVQWGAPAGRVWRWVGDSLHDARTHDTGALLQQSVYWRAMCARSSASGSSMSSPLTSTVTLWIVPVNLNGLG